MGSSYAVAQPWELPEIQFGSGIHHEYPPNGTTVFSPEPGAYVVVGTPTDGKPGDWWVVPNSEILLGSNAADVQRFVARIYKLLKRTKAAKSAELAGEWPWVWKWSEGDPMRWIHTTFRGTLGGLEQFQHGMSWGVPGADPTLAEADAPEYAHTIATAFNTTMAPLIQALTNQVVYKEIGAVQMEQDDPVGSDGSGGNRRQSYPTGWWAWPSNGSPVGAATSASLPYEVAMCVSLLTDTRGPRGKGRFYLPPLGIAHIANGAGALWEPTTVSSIGAAVGAFIQAVETATGHQALVVSGRAKQLHQVKRVEIGRVPDAQRRRRKSLDEARVLGWARP